MGSNGHGNVALRAQEVVLLVMRLFDTDGEDRDALLRLRDIGRMHLAKCEQMEDTCSCGTVRASRAVKYVIAQRQCRAYGINWRTLRQLEFQVQKTRERLGVSA